MKLEWHDFDIGLIMTTPRIDDVFSLALKDDIKTAFSAYFPEKLIVNNKIQHNDAGKPKVSNSADFFSQRFQLGLDYCGWKIECELEDQIIDGYKEFPFPNLNGQYIQKDKFINILSKLDLDDYFPRVANSIFTCNHQRTFFSLPKSITKKAKSDFEENNEAATVRVGLEFETGNIASSFRSLSKLSTLFSLKMIDVGVLVTSNTKRVAQNIWPPRNRNSSLEELKERKFHLEVRFPLMICGFAPDGWSKDKPYLTKVSKKELDKMKKQKLKERQQEN